MIVYSVSMEARRRTVRCAHALLDLAVGHVVIVQQGTRERHVKRVPRPTHGMERRVYHVV
jgi:hypothetical protein